MLSMLLQSCAVRLRAQLGRAGGSANLPSTAGAAQPSSAPRRPAFPCLQVDILSSAAEVDEVVSFVRSNAARVLGVDEPQVLPVR